MNKLERAEIKNIVNNCDDVNSVNKKDGLFLIQRVLIQAYYKFNPLEVVIPALQDDLYGIIDRATCKNVSCIVYLIKQILRKTTNINKRDRNGNNALLTAVRYAHSSYTTEVVELILKKDY